MATSLNGHLPAPSEPAELAAGIRECVAILQNDLVTISLSAGRMPGCADALRRAERQVAELNRLANELRMLSRGRG
jgi:hypothetical protein